jgi:tetratricopeptide (TPR) repeat protein
MAALAVRPVPAGGQAPAAAADLTSAITQLRAGDLFGALVALDEVVKQTAPPHDDAATLARAHAFRAMAYSELGQPERATAAVTLALIADRNIVVAAPDFSPETAALFAGARRVPAENPEAAGEAAERAGRFPEAFLAYVKAFQSLPPSSPAAAGRRVQEKIIALVVKLETKPPVPPEARDHLAKAQSLTEAEAILGGPGGAASQRAEAELREAIRFAPWWPDALLRLATVQQKLQRVDEALSNLDLYRLADPAGYAATVKRVLPPAEPEKASAPAPAVTPAVAPAVTAIGPAIIYLYYVHTMSSSGSKPKVLCDGQRVGDLENGRFIKLTAPAGSHTIKIGQTVSGVFTAGEEHYVRVSMWPYPAHVTARFATPDEARAEMQSGNIVANDPSRTFTATCAAATSGARFNFD